MLIQEFKIKFCEDLYRYEGGLGLSIFWRVWRYEAGFRLTVLMRIRLLFYSYPATRYGLYHLMAFFHHRACVRHGVHIDFTTDIGGGLYIPHALNIVVNSQCRIGRNCNLLQGVTLGVANRGKLLGAPVIGENVYIGTGAVIFGSIYIGDMAAVGANCVVTKDVPKMGVVVGVPGKVISLNGSTGYVERTLP